MLHIQLNQHEYCETDVSETKIQPFWKNIDRTV